VRQGYGHEEEVGTQEDARGHFRFDALQLLPNMVFFGNKCAGALLASPSSIFELMRAT
jgi:hypothetical protein